MIPGSSPIAIAVAQYAPGDDASANLATLDAMAATAAQRGASVVVAPEYASWFDPKLGPELARHAQPLDGPFATGVREIADRHGIAIVAGLVEEGDAGRVRNTAVAIDETGILAVYRKQHLYDAFGQTESEWIQPGEIDEPQLFEVGGIAFGMMTCYDVRFPEVARTLVDAGADAILMPAEWVRGPLKEHHWRTLVTARAIENTVYVAAADHTPPVGVGSSLIVDPRGVATASIGTEEGVALAWIDRDTIRAVRETNPSLAQRRYRVAPR